MRNREFTVHVTNGKTERRALHDAGEIREVLRHEFRIRLPDHPLLDRKLDGLPDQTMAR